MAAIDVIIGNVTIYIHGTQHSFFIYIFITSLFERKLGECRQRMGEQVQGEDISAKPIPLLTPYKMGIFQLSHRYTPSD